MHESYLRYVQFSCTTESHDDACCPGGTVFPVSQMNRYRLETYLRVLLYSADRESFDSPLLAL